MRHAEAYLKLQEKHRKEIEEFPIAYAFDEKQLEEALTKLGAKREECVSMIGHGDVMKKVDAPRFLDMLKRQNVEVKELLKNEKDAEEAFLYEMDNHEYAINWSGDEDVLACFGINEDELDEMGLRAAYIRARRKHMDNMHEWGVI